MYVLWNIIVSLADINECSDRTHCSDPNKKCVNLPGTFRCECNTGYRQLRNGDCKGMQCSRVVYINSLHIVYDSVISIDQLFTLWFPG